MRADMKTPKAKVSSTVTPTKRSGKQFVGGKTWPSGPERAQQTASRGVRRNGATNRVLGVDPGFDRLGLAVLEGDPSRPTLLWSTCVEPPKGAPEMRLAAVAEAIRAATAEYGPDTLAIETLFFSTNRKTAFAVAEARGAILATAGAARLRVLEFSPQQVKLAVTGYGAADKRSVALMIPRLVTLSPRKRRDDELDAIAVGITGLAQKS